jgi:hypothetical protein
MTEQKTLKQYLADNSIYLSDEILKRIEKAVKSYNKEWLTQKRQENSKSSLEIKRNVVNFFGKHWLDADELLEDVEK